VIFALQSSELAYHKDDPNTYTRKNLCDAYVRDQFYTRNQDFARIKALIAWRNYERLFVLGSGWGGFEKLAKKSVKTIYSCDSSLRMCNLAAINGVVVKEEHYSDFLAKFTFGHKDLIFISHMLSIEPFILADSLKVCRNVMLYDPVQVFICKDKMLPHPCCPRGLWLSHAKVCMMRLMPVLYLSLKDNTKFSTFTRDFLAIKYRVFGIVSEKAMRLINHNSSILQAITKVSNHSDYSESAFSDYFKGNPYVSIIGKSELDLPVSDSFRVGDFFSTKLGYMANKTCVDLENARVSNKHAYILGSRFNVFVLPTIYSYLHPIRGTVYCKYSQLGYANKNGLASKRDPYDCTGYKVRVFVEPDMTYFNFPRDGQYLVYSAYDKIFSSFYVRIRS